MSDPVARAAKGPAPVRRGRSRHGCRVSLSPSACGLCVREKAPSPPTSAHGSTLGLPGQSGLALPGQLDQPVRSSHRTIRSQICGRIAPAWIRNLNRLSCAVKVACETTAKASAITRSMVDLCSAPARLCASLRPRIPRGLWALTVPARSSQIGNCVMAGNLIARTGQVSSK